MISISGQQVDSTETADSNVEKVIVERGREKVWLNIP